ncbi:ABC transporter ATP-binding protein [Haploplasma axanthum]|uniref:ABC-type multidrug/protein/lipid transport system ATPase component n=1 Tax=Haploplasma axanthum TaxID=29552 RepID=A0A449BF45_HAPAX|nr:ABC transporter ATP-binding protein [Haploplasma axanthum]VEU81045.1 ABC-type multidrug/protein/lipid transport system ATPase component [Haploplasma axanthum]
MQNYKEDDSVKKISFSVWKRLLMIIKDLKGKIIVLILFAVTLAGLETVINVINKYAIDKFVENQDFTTLTPFIILNVLIAIAFGLLVWAFIKQGSIIEAHVNYNLRREAFENLQRLSFSYFDVTPQGWIMARMTSDSRRLANIISWTLLDFFWSALFMIFTLVVLFTYSWKLGLIVFASVPIMFLIAFLFRKSILNSHRESRKHNSQATAKYSEAFLGAKTTKSLVIEDQNLFEFEQVTNDLKRSSIRAISISAIFSSVLLFATYITLAIVMYQGSIDVLDNLNTTFTLGTMFLFIRATTSFFDPIMMLTSILTNVQQAQASAERIVELIETKPQIIDKEEVIQKYGDILDDKKEQFEPIDGNVEYKDITFYYKDDEKILDNFNLKIKAGSSVALVGHTGSGKTTLVNLLSRFYEPVSGEVLIDGIDYRERSIHWLHSQLGYVLQSPHLFSTTVKDNIKYGKLNATDEEMINAAKVVGAHEFIMNLDKGYDTEVGEGGNLLSLGQKQLISFARAIIANPRILILDEATSSIDSEAERVLQDATKKLLKGRTSIIVAHRLSTIVDSDLIVMLEMGKILEIGTHQELLNKRGAYFELYKNQFMQEKENSLIENV